ncbi:hypothetical protein [Cellulosimicrobium arenosum]|uniref:Major capsid protein n=1 Tax=Cellulosimicrobium arenosum TaxID=2708133 RepID=A0A927IYU8_9MICO|nr:hypothetical protein [Cellulosimicrobium arenosum]MBD8077692.1 hypothetical protein [Cellulosimicrobium arenosum]
MSTIKAQGRLLKANAADRVLEYLLLPYGEEGRTSAGRVTASAGTLDVPDEIVANMEHDGTRPVAKSAYLREEDDGLRAGFHVAETTAGNDLLVEAAEGLRTGISVEIDNPVIRAGRLLSGALTGAGFVTTPAFPSALLVASDAGEIEDETEDQHDTEGTEPEANNTEEEADVPTETENTTATVPAGSLAARRNENTGPKTPNDLFRLMANAHKTGGTKGLTAALSDIVPGDILGQEQPQYVGELWDGKAYERKIVPLFNHANLTSYNVQGWRWVTRPAVAAYAGNKTAVPSNAVETEQVSISAERIAGAHDIDRKFRDFNDAEFFAAYFAAMTESYARVSDTSVAADILAVATDVTADAVPTDVPTGLSYIVDGALAVLAATDTMPTFALVPLNLWKGMLLTPRDKTLEYLNSALGFEEGSTGGFRIQPSTVVTDAVLVGTKSAATVHELSGSPIRVEAVDVANGGIDAGLFGYYATNIHDAEGLALVTPDEG